MIVSCGEALVDLTPDAVPGGGPMNVAIAAARLGVPAAFLGRVSTDSYGDVIWQHLRDNGVDLTVCERGPEPTTRAIVEHVPELRFRFEGDGAADTVLERADLGPLGPGPHIVHGGSLALFRGRTADLLARLVELHEGIVSLDPNVRPMVIDDRDRWLHYHDRWAARAHLYRSSDEDAAWIWPGRDESSWVDELLAGAAAVVMITRGADGVSVHTAGGSFDVPGRPVEVVDTVGAGDTFVGGILASMWMRDLTVPSALTAVTADAWRAVVDMGIRAAAVTCSRRGADPPFLDEL